MKSKNGTTTNKKIEVHRSEVMLHLMYIREMVDSSYKELKELNGRVRKNESSISWIKGIGSTVTFIIGALLAWFKIDNG